jgi:quercetin dioxygenase-like cupin family protein
LSVSALFKEKQGQFDVDLGVIHHFSDGLYGKEMTLPKGYAAGTHAHEYSHFSILAKGRVILKTDDWQKEFSAPACIEIVAGVNHMIFALEDSTWFCIHATNETDINKIDDVLIKRGTPCQ